MLKKILIGLGIVVVLLVIAMFYLNNRNRTLSPSGETSLTNDNLSVTVTYSRPSVRDRVIFGSEEEGALLSYGKYWRLGANEPTDIEVSDDFLFNGGKMKAGKYVIYAIPKESEEIELRLNSDLRFWGATEPDYTMDVLKTTVKMESNTKTEQFTIDAEGIDGGVNVVFTWDKFRWEVPVLKQ